MLTIVIQSTLELKKSSKALIYIAILICKFCFYKNKYCNCQLWGQMWYVPIPKSGFI